MGVVRRLWPALLGAGLAVLALGPALAWGFVLRYDLLFVPDPPLLPDTGGFPRAVPSDLVVALLSRVLPPELVQKGFLAGIFVLAASGAAALVPPERRLARLVAAAFYAWNLYLAQRLMLGQWALLLGVAGLPWAVRATTLPWTRLALALLPAAVGGFQAMLVSALTLMPIAIARRRVPVVALTLAALSLPWLIPALTSGAVTDPAGVDAFAARADGPFGVLGSLLSLGGIWSAEAGLPGQEAWWPATVRLLLVAVGVFGYVRLRASRDRPDWWSGLAVAAGLGFFVACLGAFAPGPLKWLIGLWPGFGPLRDGQVYLAPLVLLTAVGLASVLRSGVPAVVGVLAPVLVLPTFAFGAFGRLAAVEYPPDWRAVQRIVNADPAPGALLSLPWGAHRAFAWNGGRVVLDPATKLFERRVIWDDTLLVGLPDGRRLQVRGEDPLNRRAGELMDTPGYAARLGVRYVLLSGTENRFPSGPTGWTTVYKGSDLVLLRR
ncbi:hypothetical protein [Nonomuraea sp. LPB2021202275-12-8]|uniref:hypothetical protein n=1 Tax=Nonomuraea sp. LPB2021202275-12-8 TaxID=3120159 RepID=UPI00300D129D